MTVLRPSGPRILGGLDEEAGGTWLAVNEHGVVAGLTNRPSPEGRDPNKRSRGELPVALAEHRDAASAVQDFAARFRPRDYNPAWIVVGDRTSLYALDMTGEDRPGVQQLGPGVHILENNPLHAASPKVDHVRSLLGDLAALEGAAMIERMRSVLMDHTIPEGVRPSFLTFAACVHTETYGTRSATVVSVPAAPGRHPRVLSADGPPCTAPFTDVSSLFEV
jgi:uncharacterized protein with NRDE domain